MSPTSPFSPIVHFITQLPARYVDLLGSAGFEPRNALYDVEFVVLDTEEKSIGKAMEYSIDLLVTSNDPK